jgi:hypothetical protein
LSPQIVYADRGGFSTSVHWIEPSATDNVDQNPVIRKLINISQGDILSENDYIISYEAVDMEGNTNVFVSKCDVILTVKGLFSSVSCFGVKMDKNLCSCLNISNTVFLK